ncbi:conserved hypothetical protein [Gammaproteobacteria bacterium]
MKRGEQLFMGLFLLASIGLFAWFKLNKPLVLILHSYDKDYAWVKGVNTGLRRVLDPRSNYEVRWYYLDTKRHPWPAFKAHAGLAARRTIDKMQPDVLIAVDDDAQRYVSRHYLNHPHIRIVFAGVNNEPGDYGFLQASNVTGILERLPLAALKETLTVLAERNQLPWPLRIRFLGDRSETVSGDERYFRTFDWSPLQVLESRLVDTLDEWQAALNEAQGQVDFLILSNYRKVMRSTSDKTLVPAGELIAWTRQRTRIPLIGTNSFFVEDSGMLAIGTSPYEQGEVAARLAEEILDNPRQPNQIPYRISQQFVVAMRGSAMRLHHLELPRVYEAAARADGHYFE